VGRWVAVRCGDDESQPHTSLTVNSFGQDVQDQAELTIAVQGCTLRHMNDYADTTVYFTTAEAAKQLGVSEATLRRWVKKERIGADKTVSGQYRFSEDHIAAARPRPVVITHDPS